MHVGFDIAVLQITLCPLSSFQIQGAHAMHVMLDIVVLPLTKVPRMLMTEADLYTLSFIFAADVFVSVLFYIRVVEHALGSACLRVSGASF